MTSPQSLTLTFSPGKAKGGPGKAEVWGQTFEMGASLGTWTFIEPLWTVVLGYEVSPEKFGTAKIGDDLARFEGTGVVGQAGLGLPVVVTGTPAILGEAARGGEWFLLVKGLRAKWYEPDPRPHDLGDAWVGIAPSGGIIAAANVAPLTSPVTHDYDLWTITGEQRLPWHQSYPEPFPFLYSCHVIDGEYLMVRGQAKVDLDRPVSTDGLPIRTPTSQDTVLLHRFDGKTTAMLGAAVASDTALHQSALRNALVWTSTPIVVVVQGELVGQRIDTGTAQLLFRVHAWVPTLPDPYVSNAFIRRPRPQDSPQALLVASISWRTPTDVTVSFEGQAGSVVSIEGRGVSDGAPKPARRGDNEPDAGLTQVEQGQLTFDKKALGQWKEAQAREQEFRPQRVADAQRANKLSCSTTGISTAASTTSSWHRTTSTPVCSVACSTSVRFAPHPARFSPMVRPRSCRTTSTPTSPSKASKAAHPPPAFWDTCRQRPMAHPPARTRSRR